MRTFLLRFLIFIFIWGLMLFDSNEKLVFSLLMLTISLIIYFFLSNKNASIYLYVGLAMILTIHSLVIVEYFYTATLLLLILILASFRLRSIELYSLTAVMLSFFFILTIAQQQHIILAVIVSSIITFLIIVLNKNAQKNLQVDQSTEQLKAEYRQLKRMHLSMDEVARNEERTRIAREIHDSVGHQLTALIMKLEMLHIGTKDARYLELREMANSSLAETRHAVQTLSSTDSSGIPAIIQLIRKLEAESQLLIQFTLNEGVLAQPLSNEHGVVLYRVIQEALTNVMRHAETKFVSIAIGKSAIDSLTFSITNQLHSEEKIIHGFGLNSMKDRVTHIGGTIDIVQEKNQFIIQGMIPYRS